MLLRGFVFGGLAGEVDPVVEGRVEDDFLTFFEAGFDLDVFRVELTDFDRERLKFSSVAAVAKLFSIGRGDRLDRDGEDISEFLDHDFHLGGDAGFYALDSFCDGDLGGVNLKVWIGPVSVTVGQDGDLGDFAVKAFVGE